MPRLIDAPQILAEIDATFSSLDDWNAWASTRPAIYQPTTMQIALSAVRKGGLWDPALGYIPPGQIAIDSTNLRESMLARGHNARMRAALHVVTESLYKRAGAFIYATEAVTPLADTLRTMAPNFIGSEYIPDDRDPRRKTILHQDLMRMTLPSKSVDIAVCCEVLEHVPSIQTALCQLHHTMRPGGVLIATFPLLFQEQSLVKADLVCGRVVHFSEPEFHGNPVDPDGGSLVFTVPGWDIIETAKFHGWSSAGFRMIASTRMGVFAGDMLPIPVFVAIA